jgi:V8-like Glu-specific endopeptidase
MSNEDKGRIQAVKSYLIEQGYVEAIYSIEIQPKTVSLSYATDGSSGKWEKCNLNFELPQDKGYDVAICRAESGTLPQGVDPSMIIDLKKAQTDSEMLKNTMDILLIGYPGGYTGNSSPSTGKISVKSMSGEIDGKATDKYAFHHSANGLSGSSGSPVFNMYGKFIGVHHAGFGEGNNMCYAVPAKAAVELYERSK